MNLPSLIIAIYGKNDLKEALKRFQSVMLIYKLGCLDEYFLTILAKWL